MTEPQTNSHVIRVAPTEWPALAARFRDYSYAQTYPVSAALAQRDGAELELVALHDGTTIIGAACVRLRRLPVIGGLAYVSGGPLCRTGDDHDAERREQALAILRAEYVTRHGFTLRVLAPIEPPAEKAALDETWKRAGACATPNSRRYRTFLLDLDRPLDDVLAGCSKNWRRNLRRAERAGFTLETSTNPQWLKPLTAMHDAMQSRKNFSVELDGAFHHSVQSLLTDPEQLQITHLRHGDTVIAGIACSYLGDTALPIVLAATQEARSSYGVYQLQWHTIQTAHDRGQRRYDLGGIDPEANAGVYEFKKGLRGHDVEASGPFEFSPGEARRMMLQSAEAIYRRTRRIRRRAA